MVVMGMQVVERSRMPDFRAVLRRGIAVERGQSSQCADGDGYIMLVFCSRRRDCACCVDVAGSICVQCCVAA